MEERIYILWLCTGQFFHCVAMYSISITYTLMDDYDYSLLSNVTIVVHKNTQSLVKLNFLHGLDALWQQSRKPVFISYRFLVVDGGLLNDQVVSSRGPLSFLTEKNEKEILILQGRASLNFRIFDMALSPAQELNNIVFSNNIKRSGLDNCF